MVSFFSIFFLVQLWLLIILVAPLLLICWTGVLSKVANTGYIFKSSSHYYANDWCQVGRKRTEDHGGDNEWWRIQFPAKTNFRWWTWIYREWSFSSRIVFFKRNDLIVNQVETNMFVRSLGPFDFYNMDFEIDITLRQSWRDPRLMFTGKYLCIWL